MTYQEQITPAAVQPLLSTADQTRTVTPGRRNFDPMDVFVKMRGEEALARLMCSGYRGKAKLPPIKSKDCGKHGGGSAAERSARLEARRMEIAGMLKVKKMTLAEIAEIYDRSAKRIGGDLRELKKRGLVDFEATHGGRGKGATKYWFAA
jgi:predicted HTH transcriptional regulator